jgi:predicted AlkP superfamily pyrophosphatase or phosphodiesterase
MNRTAVLNVVGLSRNLIGPDTPRISQFAHKGSLATITPAFPAVTCTAQSNYVTGKMPSEHGIVGNGWYNRELAEVQFWKQSNHLVAAPKIWEALRREHPQFTCAKLFWWYNMYSSADYAITPRPMYPADGRKVFDIYASPFHLRPDIKKDLGEFPFPAFWGPAAGIDTAQGSADAVSRWIAESAKWIENRYHPTLSLVYLPHLDYNLQRVGPRHPDISKDLNQIDAIVGELIDFFDEQSVQPILISEYGITQVDNPIHLNRIFRQNGWIAIKDELGLEMIDCGASQVFAVADHQIAHIYLNDRSLENKVRNVLEKQTGIASVVGPHNKNEFGIDHPRAGDFIAVARENSWFTYYFWFDDAVAPDFARCVDIHRKPGYDPVELFLDPNIKAVKLKILWRLLQKKAGFRMLMDLIPLDATLVKGSHGIQPQDPSDYPVFISSNKDWPGLNSNLDSTGIYDLLFQAVLG